MGASVDTGFNDTSRHPRVCSSAFAAMPRCARGIAVLRWTHCRAVPVSRQRMLDLSPMPPGGNWLLNFERGMTMLRSIALLGAYVAPSVHRKGKDKMVDRFFGGVADRLQGPYLHARVVACCC